MTATVQVPESPSERQHAWDVAWSDAAREAENLGVDQRTARALPAGAGDPLAAGTRMPAGAVRMVVAARGEVLLTRWLPPGTRAGSVRAGALPHLLEAAAAAARRPAYAVLLADRHAAAVIVHEADSQSPARRLAVGPGGRGSGGERDAEFIAARLSQAAASVAAHIVLGAGDEHVLDAVSGHLPGSLGPVTTITGDPVPVGSDDHLGARIDAALDEITAGAIGAVSDRIAASAGPGADAVRGTEAVAGQLAEQQVAVLLVAADIARDNARSAYRIGRQPTELLPAGAGIPVPLEDGLVWAALHQDAIVARLPDRAGPLAGHPAAALLRRR